MAGMTVLLLLLWAGVTLSSPVDLQKRIVGGKTCDNNKRHYHVFLEGKIKNKHSMCGGSLISESWVLTAAHCWNSEVTAFLGVHPGELSNPQSKKVKIISTLGYSDSGRSHDLMLMKLVKKTQIPPIQLPTEAECQHRSQITEVEVAGYGPTTLGGKTIPSTLQCGNFDLLSAPACETEIKAKVKCMPSYAYEHIICYTSSNVATMEGDSGGGVVYQKKLYGVHVKHTTNAKSCAGRISKAMDLCNQDYRDWIKKHTGIPFN